MPRRSPSARDSETASSSRSTAPAKSRAARACSPRLLAIIARFQVSPTEAESWALSAKSVFAPASSPTVMASVASDRSARPLVCVSPRSRPSRKHSSALRFHASRSPWRWANHATPLKASCPQVEVFTVVCRECSLECLPTLVPVPSHVPKPPERANEPKLESPIT